MLTGFVITYFHDEEHRPNGRKMLKRLVRSIRESCETDYKIFVIDNSSTIDFVPIENEVNENKDDVVYYRVGNQKLGGLTYAWNLGINYAFDYGCDVIFNINDDLVIDKTINNFIEVVRNSDCKEDGLYGPVTNPGGVSTPHQERNHPGEKIIEVTESKWQGHSGYPLNGFFLGFHSEFVEKHRTNFWIFSTREEEMWGGQEESLFYYRTPKGMRSFIVEPCYVHHDKLRTWFDARNRFGNKRTTESNLEKRYMDS